MKNIYSVIACVIISLALVQYRVSYSDLTTRQPALKVTVWDAFGYYMYLPAICKYNDFKELKWLTDIDKKYSVTGGNGWQAEKQPNGNYAFKYLGGVALMQLPFYYVGDIIAHHSHYPPDGFSPPYQYALGFGVIFYCIIAVFLLRKILLLYFKDPAVAIALLMLCLATNFIQYASIDNGQSHAYLFLLYVLVLYITVRWHQKPTVAWAALIGYIIGLAMICRPTEAIMLFIPLLWNTQNKAAAKAKWQMVIKYKSHVYVATIAGLIGTLPQLIYWKLATGSFIFDVGSKWDFLNPHFRVLLGWEKGWFIYTPITVFFIVGMFFIKKFQFRKSVLWFCFLNVYIIIAWHDWRYGGTYSTRALVQSYPVFALPFTALVDHINLKKWRYLFYVLCAYLLFVNLFQIRQYNETVLMYDGMNKAYYGRIYLNAHPSPIDMSMLDNNEMISNESAYSNTALLNSDSLFTLSTSNSKAIFAQVNLKQNKSADWLKIECAIKAPGHLWLSYLNAEIQQGTEIKHDSVRLFNAISKDDAVNNYAFYMSVPANLRHGQLTLYLSGPAFTGTIENVRITAFEK